MESTSYVLSFRMVFFYLVTTGCIFDASLCEISIDKKTYRGSVLYRVVDTPGAVVGEYPRLIFFTHLTRTVYTVLFMLYVQYSTVVHLTINVQVPDTELVLSCVTTSPPPPPR